MTARTLPTAYEAQGENTSPRWCFAFAQGCGGVNIVSRRLRPGPVALFGSPQIWNPILLQAIHEGRDWYYGDHACFGRYRYYRVTRNALQHHGHGRHRKDSLRRLGINIEPWRKDGEHVVFCPPDQAFTQLFGFDADVWEKNILSELQRHTRRPIVVRRRGQVGRMRPLAEDLQGAWALVTYSSNAAVEAVVRGVPVFCLHECAASAMGLSDLSMIESPAYPDWREQWAANLAANQWTLEEIAAGECWREIGR